MDSKVALLLAGSSARERAPVEKRGATADRWFEPLHVQDPTAARERIAAQIAAGADIVLAPTWQTHRRALMAVGESRRAVAWTQAAVEVAREGVDVGLERRAQDALPDEEIESPPPAIVRRTPLVGGVIPILDDEPEPGSGRLLPREPAAARDYDEAAGHLVDADVDLIVVETRVDDRGSRIAVEAAARTGIPAWVAATGGGAEDPAGPLSESAVATWVETSIDAGAVGLLFPDGAAALAARVAESIAAPTWGGLVGEVGDRSAESLDAGASSWLESEAQVVGLLRGARPERVTAIRATIDRRIQAELERESAASRRWDGAVRRGASMAPGGAALWVGLEPPIGGAPLPAGFEWTSALAGELRRLPEGRYRLVVAAPGSDADPSALAALLDVGGVLVAAGQSSIADPALRVLDVDDDAEPSIVIRRREQ